MACKKCDPHEICEECPEWIFTLADLIMCMMGLFVILWVLKPEGGGTPQEQAKEEQRQVEVLAAIRDAFGYQPDPLSTNPIDLQILRTRQGLGRSRGPEGAGRNTLDAAGEEGTDPEVTSIRPGPHATVGGRVTFTAGSVDLTDDARATLRVIAAKVSGHRNVLLIRAHAAGDDWPDGPTDPTAAMSLSLRRGEAVAAELLAAGVEPDVIRVQGCGVSEPLARRVYTPDALATNRRVEIEATQTLVDQWRAPNPQTVEP